MGYLLKEALKTLCAGVSHWSYAVFWKFGCQNPKLLIWEECYHDLGIPAENCIDFLVNKMMLDGHVRVLGEGLVGRVAFTGSHQWIAAENCCDEAHLPEVLKEVCWQFSAGIQTIAVVPVLPLGVVQFGSFSRIVENMGFVYDTVSLILQLGSVSSAFLSNGNAEEGSSTSGGMLLNPTAVDNFCVGYSSQTSVDDCRMPKNNVVSFHARHQQRPPVAKAEVITSGSPMLMNRNASLHDSCPSRLSGVNFSTRDISAVPANPGLMFCSEDGSASVETRVETGDDLFDILGPGYKNRLFSTQLSSRANDELAATTMHNMQPNRSLAREFSGSDIFSSNGSDDLLEAVVSQVRHSAKASADDSVSCRTALTNASSSSVPNSSFPDHRSRSSDGIKAGFFSVPQYPSKAGANGSSTAYSTKPHETRKPSRKRLKPGENPRPRPKDRQMIQDRVKELREIVPNGAKCSIDALLERTIKHMLFLQSVMNHSNNPCTTLTSEDGGKFEGGVTWAYEVGSQSAVCPIRVEDLSQPRQMLIEMICEERGLFLEIADIVRGLGLTILKGIMETRDDKIWSRFTVEANRDVTRMEIFISLVHLLEQSVKTATAQHSAVDCENQQLHHVPSVPVTMCRE